MPGSGSGSTHAWRRAALVALAGGAVVLLMPPLDAWQAAQPGACRVSGTVTSNGTPIPGVSIVFRTADAAAAATSTEPDGKYALAMKPGAYRMTAELTGFTPIERDITLEGDSCGQTVDFQIALKPRTPRTATAGAGRSMLPAQAAAGRGAAPGQRFETLAVQEQSTGALAAEAAPDREAEEAAVRQLLPPGFSNESPAQAVTFT